MSLILPLPPGKSKFDQVLEWAEKQQGKWEPPLPTGSFEIRKPVQTA